MIAISLGQRIREVREKAGLSLRKLADQIDISSPFLSDIELGRRLPSEEILVKLAAALDVSPDELKQYDTRGPIADLKCLIDSDPKLGFAFRTMSRRWSKNFQFDARIKDHVAQNFRLNGLELQESRNAAVHHHRKVRLHYLPPLGEDWIFARWIKPIPRSFRRSRIRRGWRDLALYRSFQ